LSQADGAYPYGKLTIQRMLSITSFSPATGPVGTVISLLGQQLAGATAVKVGGIAASFTVVSNTQLTVTVPPGTTSGPIQVTTPAGTATSQDVFTVTASPAPVIVNFTPQKGPAGTKVTITGTNFNNATAVRFNNVAAAFTYVSPTVITATVPAGNASGFVSVTTPGGTATSKQTFMLTPAAWLTMKAQTNAEAVSILSFPNPFSESFTLQVKGKGTDKLPFRILDPYGQVVMQGNDLRATQQIRLGTRTTWGVYYLEVGSGADVKRYKLIKRN
ncbi:MAG: IPT/TIG domain-containing protein, partial [Cytophagales bacterium]|nr:IPT/TIG domain-containing protein [Cytophagales bacterium]